MDHQQIERRKEILLSHLKSEKMIEKFGTSSKSKQQVVNSTLTKQGVCVIYLNNPPVNACSNDLLQGLEREFDKAILNKDCRAIVLASKIKRFFVAGADISVIQKLQDEPKKLKQWALAANALMNKIESSSKPTVAAIPGITLGGGLEISMACNGRICTPESTLGLPELNIGLIPGWGGTQRLPRLVGVKKALDMMIKSQNVKGEEAKSIGLVDDCVDESNLLSRACELASEMVSSKSRRRMSLYLYENLNYEKDIPFIKELKKKIVAQDLHVPHFKACIDAVWVGIEENGLLGLDEEHDQFLTCAYSDSSRALIHYFFAQRSVTKIPNVPKNTKPKMIKKICVIGGGLMGSGIATACLLGDYQVTLKEINEKFLSSGLQRIKENLSKRLKSKRLTQEKFDKMMSNLSGTIEYENFKQFDLVIEAVFENLKLKQEIFQTLEKVCSSDCILASNTSTIDIDLIGEKTKSQDRIIGLHFFSPAHVMQLLEIVKPKSTSMETLIASLEFGKRIKKTTVVVGNCIGFVVNRVFYPYGIAACWMVDNGIHPYRIDTVTKSKVQMPTGPFMLYDMIGIDVFSHVGASMSGGYDHLKYPIGIVNQMVEAKNFGQKTGSGFYVYESRKPTENKEIGEFIKKAKSNAPKSTNLSLSDEEIIEILFYPCINEACRIVEENLVYRASDIDIATCLGMGFPKHLGGLMKYGDLIGSKKIFEKLESLHKKFGEDLFKPSNYLKERALNNKSLY
eukprot:gene3410-5955_t